MYKYEHTLRIKAHPSTVFDTFFDYKNYYKWQPSLKAVHLKQGEYRKANHQIDLVYQNDTVLNESVELYDRPHTAVFTYCFQSVFNRQMMYFKKEDEDTLLTVVTEFYFPNKPNTPKSVFEEQTLKNLKRIKSYIETIK